MGQFSGIKKASVSKSGQYFQEGTYLVEILRVKMQDSDSTPGKQFFIIETEVHESNNEKIEVGMEKAQIIPMGEVMTLPNIKGFMGAVSGVDPLSEDINEQVEAYWQSMLGQFTDFEALCELVISDANPLGRVTNGKRGDEMVIEQRGTMMKVECVDILTKGKKKPFTKIMWQARDLTEAA